MAERLFIEGYADQLSVPAGGDITLHVSTNMSNPTIKKQLASSRTWRGRYEVTNIS